MKAIESHCFNFLFFFSLIYLFIFYFIILFWFCHILTWICHGCTCVPHPERPSHLFLHPIPLGHPSAPAPSTLSHALDLDWWFISHLIICMFQRHSPISSRPCPLPQSPKDCSVHLSLLPSCTQGYCYHVSNSKTDTNQWVNPHLPRIYLPTDIAFEQSQYTLQPQSTLLESSAHSSPSFVYWCE